MVFYNILSAISIVVVVFQIVFRVIPWLYENFVGPALCGSSIKLRSMGSWALVTGSTDGIGKAYANALAKQGINIVLVSRSLSKLENVSKEIESEHKVQTKIIDVDFTGDQEIYEKIEKGITGLDIGVLVNNVGMTYPSPEYFLQMNDRDLYIRNMLKCNILSVTSMCQMIMPQMIERCKGVIINVSSLSGLVPSPLLTTYAATKLFVDKFTGDLQDEYSPKGIIFQSVCAGTVATNMSKIRKSTWMAPSPKVFVASALRTVGIATHTTGYYPHTILQITVDFIKVLSPTLLRSVTIKTMENIKKRAIKRAAAKSETTSTIGSH